MLTATINSYGEGKTFDPRGTEALHPINGATD